MENLLAQHLSRVTAEDARSFALIEEFERANPHLSEEKLLQLVERSPYGRALATRMGAPLARSISMPSVTDADHAAPRQASLGPLRASASPRMVHAPAKLTAIPAMATAWPAEPSGEKSPKRARTSLSASTSCLPE